MPPFFRRFGLVCTALFFLASPENPWAQETPTARGELIVKLKTMPQQTRQSLSPEENLPPTLRSTNEKYSIRKVLPLFAGSQVKGTNSLNNILKLTFSPGVDVETLAAIYAADPAVEYAQPNYVHKIDVPPNDPLLPSQLSLQLLNAEAAWSLQLASPDVIVGVIDTGIDYEHEDLADAVWLNAGEDLDADGLVTASDFNGIDDDGNGFIDDIRGWDFTDAPTFADGGDFETPDNDPFDENGHGTNVAGIIGATGNNGKGIAGLAYGCKIMPLRAGTSQGFLEEDDVAAALVYAVRNGARIINMSFGDNVASPLLRDVMAFAHAQNCILVAAAGNASTDVLHFPSGFPETISVGATDAEDQIAGFSNYGSSVDVVAPGVGVVTTFRGNKYSGFSGTSASAPFVSALAALIISKTPQLTNEAVRGVLVSSTDDLGEPGWDNFFASGRINAAKALASPYFTIAQITSPALDAGFAQGPIEIRGTILGTFLQSYRLQIGQGETPAVWTDLTTASQRQIIDESIFDLDIGSFLDDVYTLRLVASNADSFSVEDKLRFFIDRSAPQISAPRVTAMLDGSQPSLLLEFETDDITQAKILFRRTGSPGPFQSKPLRFRTDEHQINLTQDEFSGDLEFAIEATNRAHLTSRLENDGMFFQASLPNFQIGGLPVESLNFSFPAGHLLHKEADFDQDGSPEVIFNPYDANFRFTKMKILELTDNGFTERFSTEDTYIPRDWGDSDGDGRLEILAGHGGTSAIFEATGPRQLPDSLAWTDGPDVWGSRFADLDQDGKGEIIVRHEDIFRVRERVGDNLYAEVARLPNPTDGSNQVGVPRSVVADFDGDGLMEILLGDFDGDVYIYENRADDQFEFTWSQRMPVIDTIDFLSAGDYDNDGVTEFVVGGHTDPGALSESTFEGQHWTYRIYKKNSNDNYDFVWQQSFLGFQPPVQFDSGVSSGDIDNDGFPEILVTVFPDFYIVDYDQAAAEYEVIWHSSPARSNAVLVTDIDRDGHNEFFFNDGDEFKARRWLTEFRGAASPTGLSAVPLDSALIRLTWYHAGTPDGFRVYRGTAPKPERQLATTQDLTFEDSSVDPDSTYTYFITAVDSSRTPVESRASNLVRVQPNAKPFVLGAIFARPNQLTLSFSEPMNTRELADTRNYDLAALGPASSAIASKLGQEVVLTTQPDPQAGEYAIRVTNVTDVQGTPLDSARADATFTILPTVRPPYLVTVDLVAPARLRLQFNEAMDPASTQIPTHFDIEPSVSVLAANLDASDDRFVILVLDEQSSIGRAGQDHVLRVKNVKSRAGVAIRFGEGDTAALSFASPDLDNLSVYPNPYKADSERTFVTVTGLTGKATVRILNANGKLIRTLQESDGNGGIDWDLRDESGRAVSSGIYLFYVTGGGQKKVGKLAVLR